MADEFAKGLGIFAGASLAWMILAGWYRTASFESTRQLIDPLPENLGTFDQIGVLLMDGMLYFALLGALTFWVLIPGARQLRRAIDSRRQGN
jgi:hypothetical protein